MSDDAEGKGKESENDSKGAKRARNESAMTKWPCAKDLAPAPGAAYPSVGRAVEEEATRTDLVSSPASGAELPTSLLMPSRPLQPGAPLFQPQSAADRTIRVDIFNKGQFDTFAAMTQALVARAMAGQKATEGQAQLQQRREWTPAPLSGAGPSGPSAQPRREPDRTGGDLMMGHAASLPHRREASGSPRPFGRAMTDLPAWTRGGDAPEASFPSAPCRERPGRVVPQPKRRSGPADGIRRVRTTTFDFSASPHETLPVVRGVEEHPDSFSPCELAPAPQAPGQGFASSSASRPPGRFDPPERQFDVPSRSEAARPGAAGGVADVRLWSGASPRSALRGRLEGAATAGRRGAAGAGGRHRPRRLGRRRERH
ncbi:unnamed protein product [Prorocentrum cordatum]|uniref:Uncharacterized protein n=1 Tax=Prorocentrum cordatum TaxID=2364126 RepID=A0ABN9VK18_9DINO|nr:unnamed protein product [Polarella glacialis]